MPIHDLIVYRVILAIVGVGVFFDGIGSILLQLDQAWYWQFERVVRSFAGLIVLAVAILL